MTVLLRYSIQNFQEFPIRRLFTSSKKETELFNISAYAPFFQAIIFVLSISCHRKIDNVRGLIIHEPFPVLEEGGGEAETFNDWGRKKNQKKTMDLFPRSAQAQAARRSSHSRAPGARAWKSWMQYWQNTTGTIYSSLAVLSKSFLVPKLVHVYYAARISACTTIQCETCMLEQCVCMLLSRAEMLFCPGMYAHPHEHDQDSPSTVEPWAWRTYMCEKLPCIIVLTVNFSKDDKSPR